MLEYHGTNNNTAQLIASNQVDVTLGGGELGQGFYTGDLKHEAFTWAHQKYGITNKAVVELSFARKRFRGLNTIVLKYQYAWNIRRQIRNNNATRTHLFNVDAVCSPVVGKYIPNFNQIKWESLKAQSFLNGHNVAKNIL